MIKARETSFRFLKTWSLLIVLGEALAEVCGPFNGRLRPSSMARPGSANTIQVAAVIEEPAASTILQLGDSITVSRFGQPVMTLRTM